MKRTYLEEDLRLIHKYFPGARQVPLRTPFDLTVRSAQPQSAVADTFRGEQAANYGWGGETAWMH